MFSFHVVLSYAVMAVVFSQSTNGSRPRDKRIVWGEELTDYNSYDVVGYFAYIAKGNSWSWVFAKLYKYVTGSIPDNRGNSLTCGGALIAEFVVQTACHCIALFLKDKTSQPIHISQPKNGWEYFATIWVGFTIVGDMKGSDGTYSKKFLVHPKCGVIWHGDTDTMTNDLGLIILNRPVKFRLLHQKMAPLYPEEQIVRTYQETMSRASVCLFVGFGAYYWKKPGIHGKFSAPMLQHGWRMALSYLECYHRVAVRSTQAFWAMGLKYGDAATWICTSFFGKQRAGLLPGDSGSPSICQGYYAGVISFRDLLHRKTNISTDYFGSLRFGIEYNAREYRKGLIEFVKSYVDKNEWPPTGRFTAPIKSTWDPYFDYNRKHFKMAAVGKLTSAASLMYTPSSSFSLALLVIFCFQ